jgi:hypothetical protein
MAKSKKIKTLTMPETLQQVLDNGAILNKLNVIRANGNQTVIDLKGDWDGDATGYVSMREDEFVVFFYNSGTGHSAAFNFKKEQLEILYSDIDNNSCGVNISASGVTINKNGSAINLTDGVDGSFTDPTGNTITVTKGIITAITPP